MTRYNVMRLDTGKCKVDLSLKQVEDLIAPDCGGEVYAVAEAIEEHTVFETDDWLVWDDEHGVPGLACHGIMTLYYDDYITSTAAIALVKMATDSEGIKQQTIETILESYGP